MIFDTHNAPQIFISNRLNEVKVRFYGDTAIAQGNESWERRVGRAAARPLCLDRYVDLSQWAMADCSRRRSDCTRMIERRISLFVT
jgi:hypothetical protein